MAGEAEVKMMCRNWRPELRDAVQEEEEVTVVLFPCSGHVGDVHGGGGRW